MSEKKYCQDYGDKDVVGCEKFADEIYTMDFKVPGEEPIYWCKPCGERAHNLLNAINRAAAERGDSFFKDLEKAIEEAKKEIPIH